MKTREDSNMMKCPEGNVKAFTRHTARCPHRKDKKTSGTEFNKCKCPKWLYVKLRGQKETRTTLNTPSWAEAERRARTAFDQLDPKSIRLRQLEADLAKKESERVTLADAIARFLNTKRHELAADSRTPAQFQVATTMLTRWALRNNITYLDEIKDTQLESWYWSTDGGADWSRLKETTRSQRWGMLRSTFLFWQARKLLEVNPISLIKKCRAEESVQGPFDEEQERQLLAAALTIPPPYSMPPQDKPLYNARLHAFISLLRHTGCDVCDGMLFRPEKIVDRYVAFSGKIVSSYSYFRRKTRRLKPGSRVQSVVNLPPEIAKILRNVPLTSSDTADMPFRGKGVLRSDFWSAPIRRCLEQARITHVSLGVGDDGVERFHTANVKQLRHTFAVRQLRAGHSMEDVARMLGHSGTDMIRTHYAPFVKELHHAAVEQQEKTRMANLPNHGLTVVSQSASDEHAQQRLKVSAS